MTVAQRHNTILLGGNGLPFNRYVIRYGIVTPDDEDDNNSLLASKRLKCLSWLSECSATECCLLLSLSLIATLYTIDCSLELRRLKFTVHLALCTLATILSIVHIAIQILAVMRSSPIPLLYEHAAVNLTADVESYGDNDKGSNFGSRCYKMTAEGDGVMTVGVGVAAIVFDIMLLIIFYACGVDLGWTLIPNILLPLTIGVVRMTDRNHSYHKWIERDANVSRAVVLEAVHLLREQQLLLPAGPSSAHSYDGRSTS
jgi:hypothetical protein